MMMCVNLYYSSMVYYIDYLILGIFVFFKPTFILFLFFFVKFFTINLIMYDQISKI